MATIPIEIILQDAEAPVDPTPTPEETNIVVPDTGAGTIGNNTFSSSSAASIILPAILLVVALATVCTVLIHKHCKRQDNDKFSKKEKLLTAASTTIAVLSATVLVGNLVTPATKAATSDTEVSIEVPDKISIVVNREDDTAEATTGATAYITSTATFGYKVLLSMAEGVETSNLYLGGDTTSEYYIAPVEEGTLEANTWGYMLSDEEAYSAVPLVDDAALALKGYNNVVDKETTIDYGVRVDKDLPAGTYMGEIEYVTGNAIEYMQDFATLTTEEKSSVLTSMAEDQQYYLKDNRDNKTYHIAKLKDGNLWMTQNLDLQKEDLLDGVILDDTNTNNPANNFELPDSQTNGNESWRVNNDGVAGNTPHVYDIGFRGDPYKQCLDYSDNNCVEYGNDIPNEELGNLYNWFTATAGTGTYNMESGEALGSICPSGWRLPNGASSGTATEYSNLLYKYGILESATSGSYSNDKLADRFTAPLLFVFAGVYNGGGVSGVGIRGSLWSSFSADLYSASALSMDVDRVVKPWNVPVRPWEKIERVSGGSVRCLAR